ncbi:MAG: chloride channel protein [Verrucomicrobia bacterium]|nr:chloride channel protein [Verrucomicrobiota bacterium]
MPFLKRSLPDWMRARLDEGQRFLILCIVCGVCCGFVAVAFHLSIHFIFEALWSRAQGFGGASAICIMIAAPAVAGLVVGLAIKFFAPSAAGSGIPQVRAAYYNEGGRIPLMAAVWRFVLGALYIGFGNALGREGPTAHMSSAIASSLGRWAFRDGQRSRAMVPVGMAAGFAAAFNAPLAAITFVFEELLDNFSMRALGGIVVAVVIAAAISRGLLGDQPILSGHLQTDYHVSLWMLVAIPLGLLAGLLGHLVVSALLNLRGFLRNQRRWFPLWLQPAVGGLLCGLLGIGGLLWTQSVSGTGERSVFSIGYESLDSAFENELLWQVLAILLVLKLLAVVVTYSSGGSGGLFSPALFLGGMLGGLVGTGLSWFHNQIPIPGFPGAEQVIGGCVLLGMGASFASIIRSPFTSLIIIFEMTGNYTLILPLMAGNILAWGFAKRLRPVGIYNSLLLQDGITLKRMPAYRGPQDYRNLPVSTIMTHEVTTLDGSATVAENLKHLREARLKHTFYPIVDARGHLLGTLNHSELETAMPDLKTSGLVIDQDLTVAHPDSSIREIANRMVARDFRMVPVVSQADPGKLLGVLTLNDIARQRFAEESDL